MKSLIALTMLTAVLGLGAPGAAQAAPLAPAAAIGAVAVDESGIDDVRWVKRCRNVRVLRHGHRVTVQRCSRVWVRPRR